MTAITGEPWHCASGDCRGRRADCTAPMQNRRERLWLERHEWDNAWLAACGLPVLTIEDARQFC